MPDNSQNDCIKWMNSSLGLNLKSPDELSGGVPYCKLMSLMFPTFINMENVVIENQRTETGSINNFQILFSVFEKKRFHSEVELVDLATGDKQAHVKFIQWFHSKFHHRVAVSMYSNISRKVTKKLEFEEKQVRTELLRALQEQSLASETLKVKYSEINKTTEKKIEIIQVWKKLQEDAKKAAADVKKVVDDVLDFTVDKAKWSNNGNMEKFHPKIVMDIIGKVTKEGVSVQKSSTVHVLASAVENSITNICTAMNSIRMLEQFQRNAIASLENITNVSEHVQKQEIVVREMENVYKSKVRNSELANAASQDCQYALSVLDAYDVCKNPASKSRLSVDAFVAVRDARNKLASLKTIK